MAKTTTKTVAAVAAVAAEAAKTEVFSQEVVVATPTIEQIVAAAVAAAVAAEAAKTEVRLSELESNLAAAKLEAEIAKQKAAVLGQDMPYRAYLNSERQQIHVTLPAKLVYSPRVAQIADPKTGNIANKIVGYDCQIMLVDRNRSTTPILTAEQQNKVFAMASAMGIPSLDSPDKLTQFASLLPRWAPKGKDEAVAASNCIKEAFNQAPGAGQSFNSKLTQ